MKENVEICYGGKFDETRGKGMGLRSNGLTDNSQRTNGHRASGIGHNIPTHGLFLVALVSNYRLNCLT